MKPFVFIHIGIATLLLSVCVVLISACADDAVTTLYEADAVHLTVRVLPTETAATRSADDADTPAAEFLAEGTSLRLSTNGTTFLPYTVSDNQGTLAALGTCVGWQTSQTTAMQLWATNTDDAFAYTVPTQQNTAELLAAADYLTFCGTITRGENNTAQFALQHRLAYVSVQMGQVPDLYADCTFDVTFFTHPDVTVQYTADGANVTSSGTLVEVAPFNASLTLSANGNSTAATALLAPTEAADRVCFAKVQLRRDGVAVGDAIYAVGMPELRSGCSYNFSLDIDKDLHICTPQTLDWAADDELSATATLEWYTFRLDDYASADDFYSTFCAAVNYGYGAIKVTGTATADMTSKALFNASGIPSVNYLDLSEVKGMTQIDDWTFTGASSLRSIKFPTDLDYIGDFAFYGCSNLRDVELPSSMTHIAGHVFMYCTSLKSIVFPNSITSMGEGVLQECSSLTYVSLPTGCESTKLNHGNLEQCKSLTTVVNYENATYCGSMSLSGVALEVINLPEATTVWSNFIHEVSCLKTLILPKVRSWALDPTYITSDVTQKIDLVIHQDNASNVDWSAGTFRTQPFKSITLVDDDGIVTATNNSSMTVGKGYS